MSELRVTIERINKLESHPNADRLDLATVLGWQCVVQKDLYEEGDLIVYFPIDVILTEELEAAIFGTDSKIKLKKSRIKTIKLRGAFSQGLVVPLGVVKSFIPDLIEKEGKNIAKELGVKKFEPKTPGNMRTTGGQQKKKKDINSNFKKYTSINHLKNYPKALEGEKVVISEKIHGTNFRCGYVPISGGFFTRTWKRIKALFSGGQKYRGYEFVFGSHNVQLSNKFKKTFYTDKMVEKNVYYQAVEKYNLKDKLALGDVLYGEIYGAGIQENYNYGLKDEIKLIVFDIMSHGKYLSCGVAKTICSNKGLDFVPIIEEAMFSSELVEKHVSGPSLLSPTQKIREGIVVKPVVEKSSYMGRMVFKFINPAYLLKDNTEYH